MTTQHTPTPWKYENIEGKDNFGFPSHLHRIAQARTNIYVLHMESRSANDNVDAAFIVRACNAHDANVARIAELEEALRSISEAAQFGIKDADVRAECGEIARAAIKADRKQRGEPPLAWCFEARHIDSAWTACVSLKHPGAEGAYLRNVRACTLVD